jgi:polyisoprenyl-teichoic acid--peptidoglycan teichoic acid transferase
MVVNMEKPKIDLLKEKYEINDSEKKPFVFFGKVILSFVIVAATLGGIFSYQVSTTSESNMDAKEVSFFSTLKSFVQSGDRLLSGEKNDRVNILLMGVGGEGHEGPQLSDTIIFSSYRPSTKEVGFMSLPRDMTVPIPDYGYRKINHANAYGENEKRNYGPVLASEVIGNVLDQEINYYLRVDFSGFSELIDTIGGVDVYVDKSFQDPAYPILGKENAECGSSSNNNSDSSWGDYFPEDEVKEASVGVDYSCRFEALSFKEGWTHMDGDTALKFVRSRHGNNGEGSDFSRSRRQQKIIMAVKDKLFSASTFLNPGRISKILNTLNKNIATNISVSEFLRLAKDLKDVDTEMLTHHVIDASNDSPLYATSLNGSYVLLPKNDDWTTLQKMTKYIYTKPTHYSEIAPQAAKPKFVKVEIQNGTSVTGLAFRASQLLDGQGFDVTKIGNAVSREYEHTVIYDLTEGKHTDELKALQSFLKADVNLSASGFLVSGNVVPKQISVSSEGQKELATQNDVDFLIILGENSASLVRK